MKNPKRNKQRGSRKPEWIACVHVMHGRAREVWCRSDRIAVCPDCAIIGNIIHPALKPQLVRTPYPHHVAAADLARAVVNAAIVRGRKHLERDLRSIPRPMPPECETEPAGPDETGRARTGNRSKEPA